MTCIVRDLLDVARIESDRLAVETVRVSVASLLEEAASILQPVVERRGQRFVCRWSAGLPDVCVDRERILQVFSNLLGNAVKFTPEDGTVTLSAVQAGEGVRFSVSDTGSGIAEEQLPHIFDRFWQATRADRRGIGLGLAVVRALVEAQSSRVEVESTLGRGSTFSFVLCPEPSTSPSSGVPGRARIGRAKEKGASRSRREAELHIQPHPTTRYISLRSADESRSSGTHDRGVIGVNDAG